MSDWQPIDTAPKDGTQVLLWTVHANARYCTDPVAEGYEGPVIGSWIEHNGGGWCWYGLCGHHTHWMPLPGSPAGEIQNGSLTVNRPESDGLKKAE